MIGVIENDIVLLNNGSTCSVMHMYNNPDGMMDVMCGLFLKTIYRKDIKQILQLAPRSDGCCGH